MRSTGLSTSPSRAWSTRSSNALKVACDLMKSLVLLTLLASLLVAPPAGAAEEQITNQDPPVVTGEAIFRETLTATPGTWSPADVTTAYQWLRDGQPVADATSSTYRLRLADIGHQLAVQVTASKPPLEDTQRTSAPTGRVRKAFFTMESRPVVTGSARFERTLTAGTGSWSPRPAIVRYQWLRNGDPIKGARSKRHRIGVADVGARLRVRVTVRHDGYRKGVGRSREVIGRHRVGVRHAVTYSVTTRGHVHASIAVFKRLAQQTYDDPRGWRGAGVAFRRVESGGSFRLVLSEASLLPSFGYPCDSTWSCRVGNFVIINQDRWLGASPMWNSVGRSLRDYRHMVVNHETGHWLGHRHSYCGGPGHLAPVMMQQSKGLHGCRANPWPLPRERTTPRF
jgi:hypothetical protein